jgi:hypothetical protein
VDPIEKQLTLNRDVYLALFQALLDSPHCDYSKLGEESDETLPLCGFFVDGFEIVCVDLSDENVQDLPSYHVAIACDGAQMLLDTSFGSLQALNGTFEFLKSGTEKILLILQEARALYVRAMKMRFDSWNTTQPLNEFVGISDESWIPFLLGEY